MSNLEPIDPETALEMYLQSRQHEVSPATIRSHQSRLKLLTNWCYDNDITNLNNLTGRDLHRYRLWRRNDGNLAPASEKTQMDTVRVFIKWLETIDAVDPDLHTRVVSPSLTGGDNIRDVMVEAEEAEAAINYLNKYHYGSRLHVVIVLLWQTMMRRGAVRVLDLCDFNHDEQFIRVKNRPESGTRLKNGNNGERYIALQESTCDLLADWIANQRPEVKDENGREPLISTRHGRIHRGTVQNYAYAITRPCFYDGACPHNKEIQECDAAQAKTHAHGCPSSEGPHAIRRGAITASLRDDVPETVVGDRANVAPDVLSKHYDQRTQRESMEQRRDYFS